MADSEPTLPPPLPPDALHSATDALTQSMRSFRLRRDSSPASSIHAGKLSPSPRALSRRASLDIRSAASSPAPDRQRSRAPSTPPTVKKRASLASFNSGHYDGASTPQPAVRRRASLLSLRSSPTADLVPEVAVKKDMTPPPQDPYAATTVILHDTSYKHRYSRPKTSLAELASIVERPERIPAAVLGICAAQVRAGKERLSINKSTRFGKLSDPEVMLVHAHTPLERVKKSWPDELAGMCAATAEKLKRGQVEVPSGYHQGDLYLCGESLEDLEGCIGAVYDGVDAVFGSGPVKKAFVCIRPPGHHCAEREPSGFCWLNNVHIAIAHAAKAHGLSHAVILDFDLHHGDGSQAIAWSINELAASGSTAAKKTQGLHVPTIGYFSLHDINSYPCENGDKNKIQSASINVEAHGQFIHNVHLKPYGTDDDFWSLYNQQYSSIFSKARDFLTTAAIGKQRKNKEFRAGIFLSAGFDASEHESPGMQRHKVNVPTDFFAKFTADAVLLADELCEGRVVSVLEGGYSDRALTSGVFAHISGLSCVAPDQVGFVPSSIALAPFASYAERQVIWDRGWWNLERLQELERLTAKVPKKAEPKKTSYMDATAASVARISDTPRRVSSSSGFGSSNASPAPPPPKPWEVQAYQLSKYFIPTFDETVAIPAVTKAKPQRHSFPAEPKELTMTLRERKPRAAAPVENGRRTTVTGPLLNSSSRNVSRAPSRVSSRAPTPALNSRASTPALARRPSTTASTGATVAGPRQPIKKPAPPKPAQQLEAAVDVDELSGKLAKVKITFNKERAERERVELLQREHEEREQLEKMERDKREIEARLQQAREEKEKLKAAVKPMVKRNSGGSIPRPVSNSSTGGAVASARRKLEAATPIAPPRSPVEIEDGVTSQSSGRSSLPSSPPQMQLNGAEIPGQLGENVLGHFHGVVRSVSPAAFVAGRKDMTFKGGPGDIRFSQNRVNGQGAFGGV